MIRFLTSAAATMLFTATAWADDGPKFTAEFTLELESDYSFSSTDPAAEISDTYATIETSLGLAFSTGTSLNAVILFEPVLDAVDDRFFEDHGLYIQELFLAQEVAGFELKLGKFGPAFGVAWDDAPGLYGADFAEDYEIAEKLGFAVAFPFEAAGGEHEVAVSAFTADRTVFSNSFFQDRGRTRLSDGGVSNTNGLNSFAFSVSGAFGATGYNAGLQLQSRGQGDTHDQYGFVFGLGPVDIQDSHWA